MTPPVILRGGTVLDGTGRAGRAADVAVAGGRIAAVGGAAEARAAAGRGARVLEVAGAVVCPGFIDLHSHADFTVMGSPQALTQTAQGVTTLVTGNCGFSPFPLNPRFRDDLVAHCGFLDDGLSWEWCTAGDYAETVDRLPLGVNLALQVGHGSLRIAAMGPEDRSPSAAERERMAGLLREAAADGVVGMSSGLIYAPGMYAGIEELVALATEAARAGLLHSTHLRSESSRLAEAVEEALSVARRSGVRLQISHLKAAGVSNWGAVAGALRQIEAARAHGVDVAADQYPYSASSTTLTSALPGWAMDGGVQALLARLDDAEQSARLAAELAAREGADFRPDRIVLAATPPGPFRTAIGRTVAEVAATLGCGAGQAVTELLRAQRGQVGTVNHSMSEDDVRLVMRHPAVAVASDGWVLRCPGEGRPHPRSFGTFARVLGHYVRSERVLELPEAVRRMTSLPASRLGWNDRGLVREGAVADLVVLDPDRVRDRSTFEEPWHLATGVLHTLIAGRPVREHGEPTGEPAGRVLRRPRSRETNLMRKCSASDPKDCLR
ncbi:D-aminoacylase [Streptomyces sp. ACA25]|uniref:N-acyl-D-amino-acid deacylase family protein n=1 Tax=Streptomyces sp. ACA25 TaxID=3022596 RepID=UPI0023082686|nr:D-aminoacylase [Streptomyces sp. ACA25]MDB1086785.1 D-aminoacylase [Streptomyces sp. ACA25]